MTDITLVKRTDLQLSDEQRATLRLALFEMIDGLGESDQKSWRRFWNWITRAGAGEMVVIKTTLKRNSKFHRKFFALLNVGFEAWDPGRKHKTYKGVPVEKNFEQFREDVTILAGYYDQTFGISGEMRLKAKSISFTKMDQAEFEQLYSAVADVLIGHVLENYSNRAELDEVVDRVMRFL